ncbi:MAG: type II secretion system protein [Chloroflexi bacterium]|nr:type II secretion system protein [Chloroflexota bacterium]
MSHRRLVSRWLGREDGFTLLEVMLAVGILGFIGVAFLSAVANSSRSARTLDEHVQAEALAKTQIEQIKAATYSLTPYPSPTPGGLPPQYSISITTTYENDRNLQGTPTCASEYLTPGPNSCDTLQKITVSIDREGRPILSITTYKKK